MPKIHALEARDPTRRPHGTRWTLALAALAVATHWPSLHTGLFADDLVQHHVLEHGTFGPTLRPWALFDFGTALAFEQDDAAGAGVPWWTAQDWKARFWRPVASLWIWAEHALLPCPRGHQSAALVLFAVLVAIFHRLALRLGLSLGAATTAAGLFSLQASTHLPVAWTANRNSLLEAVFGSLALFVALTPVQRPERPWLALARPMGALLLAWLATLSKESGVLFFPLLVWALASRPGPADRTQGSHARRGMRWRALAAALALGSLALYPILWTVTGHGSTSLYYPVPWQEPALVLERATLLFSAGLASLVSPLSLDLIVFQPGHVLTRATVAIGLLTAATLGVLLRMPTAGRGPEPARSPDRFLAVWLLLTLAAQAPAPPSDRLLLVPAIPAMALLASRTERVWRRTPSRSKRGAIAATLSVVALAAAADLVVRQLALATAAREARRAHADLLRFDGDVLLLQLPNALTGLGLGPAVRAAGASNSLRPWPLQFGRGGLELTSPDGRDLVLRSEAGSFLSNSVERVFGSFEHVPRGPDPALRLEGSHHRTSAFEITVLEGAPRAERRDHLPALSTLRLRFEPRPDGRRPTLLRWTPDGWNPVPWPTPAQPRSVPPAHSEAPLAP